MNIITTLLLFSVFTTMVATMDSPKGNHRFQCLSSSDGCETTVPGMTSGRKYHRQVMSRKDVNTVSNIAKAPQHQPHIVRKSPKQIIGSHFENVVKDDDQHFDPSRQSYHQPSIEHSTHIYKRENGSNFHTAEEHSTAFNVIHVIIGVIGVAGAGLVCFTIFLMYRRRKQRKDQQLEKCSPLPTPFDQFAHAYGHEEENVNPPQSTHTVDRQKSELSSTSPSMQQVRLQWQMMELQRGQQTVTAADLSLPLVSRPPPPYQP